MTTIKRRSLIKVIAPSIIATALKPDLLSPLHISAKPTQPSDDTEALLALAAKDDIGIQLVKDLAHIESLFNPKFVQQTETQEAHTGILLFHASEFSQAHGCTIALTFNLKEQVIAFAQYVIGYCTIDRLDLISTIFDRRNPLYPEIVSPRVPEGWESPMIRPREVNEWTFVREGEPALLEKDQFTLVGYPPESKIDWHYQGCIGTTWLNKDGVSAYLCQDIAEQNTRDARMQRVVTLSYITKEEGDK